MLPVSALPFAWSQVPSHTPVSNVSQMVDEKMDPPAAKSMLQGSADPLNSTFHLGYNMLLNLLRVEGSNPEQLMANSFYQFQNERVRQGQHIV